MAHDFTNLLAVIMTEAELLRMELGENAPSVNSLIKAASRGSELTKKLLAFSRKQALRPQPIDVHSLISGMTEILTRTLGADIAIRVPTPKDLWTAYADPGQLESAILNLAINARDAMSEGGQISFGLENFHMDNADRDAEFVDLREGDYVKIEVADNGSGMAPDVTKRAFDPFYTTKGVGESSGLGLSMVYGFVQQSGGDVTISSIKGEGTKVRIYLPRSLEAAQTVHELSEEQAPKGRGEVILVLEDDTGVRKGIAKLLTKLGYSVRQAMDGKSALAELVANTDIDLLLCDIMLPGGMRGPEVADEARQGRPDLKVVFMTGYADDISLENQPVTNGAPSLIKPVKMVDLAVKLREALTDGNITEVREGNLH